MTVKATGVVAWIGPRKWPDDEPDPISGRPNRPRLASGGTIPAAFTRSSNGAPRSRRGHRGGHRHPTSVKDLLERCEAAGLDVEELSNKGGHWKSSCPEGWSRPPRATSGSVFVSSTTEFRAVAKNTNKILRETGVDVRDVDPAAIRRRGRLRSARADDRNREMTTALADPTDLVEVELADPTDTPTDEQVPTDVPADEQAPETPDAAPTGGPGPDTEDAAAAPADASTKT